MDEETTEPTPERVLRNIALLLLAGSTIGAVAAVIGVRIVSAMRWHQPAPFIDIQFAWMVGWGFGVTLLPLAGWVMRSQRVPWWLSLPGVAAGTVAGGILGARIPSMIWDRPEVTAPFMSGLITLAGVGFGYITAMYVLLVAFAGQWRAAKPPASERADPDSLDDRRLN